MREPIRFAPPRPTPRGFARRVPPMIFPSVMGLFALGLALRSAGGDGAVGLLAAVAELLLGATSLLFLAALATYAVKVARRPGVLVEEVRLMHGRLGLSAMAGSASLFVLALAPYTAGLAMVAFCVALLLHGVVVALILSAFLRGPVEQRRYSPAGHLYFVSPALGAAAAGAVGLPALGNVLLAATVPVALGLWAGGLATGWGRGAAPALRPLLALHLLSAAVVGLAALMLGLDWLTRPMLVLSALMAVGMAVAAPWLTRGSFAPLWSVFSAPVALTAAFWLAKGGEWWLPGLAALAVAAGVVLPVAYRVGKMAMGGQLAVRTNAAIA